MGIYELVCPSGEVVEERYTLGCPNGHPGLLHARYQAKQLNVKPCRGVFKFYDWLPVRSTLETESAPAAFRSEGLSKELGLPNLTVGFTGYYPERGAFAKSCTFKELEALPTFARLNDNGGGTIVLSSAGNTARAFAQTATDTGGSCVIVVPKAARDRIAVSGEGGSVTLITVDGDYSDAIRLGDRIVPMGRFVPEGGAKNVARRDGMGTVMLEGAVSTGRIPDCYFQAVGSGTGGIAAWEASMRLIGDGRYGDRLPKLCLSQNLPFTPMAKAWRAGRRNIAEEDLGRGREDTAAVFADVLTNRSPPYAVAGGLYDALTDCGGGIIEVTNEEARSAEKTWMQIEDVRPDPAASVALASLIKAVEDGLVGGEEHILLNMTGGGLDRAKEELSMRTIAPTAEFPIDVTDEEIREVLPVARVRDG